MPRTDDVVVVRGAAELMARASHLFEQAGEVVCAADDLHTWAMARPRTPHVAGRQVRKLYRPAVLLDPSTAQHLRTIERQGARIRITPDELNETIILDRRVVILAGDAAHGLRSYSVITRTEVVDGVLSLFEAAWRAGRDLAAYDRDMDEVRELAPRIVELLASGCKDETAARTLGLSLRTYRRRVAELMSTLGATSRFQAGVRARELGLL